MYGNQSIPSTPCRADVSCHIFSEGGSHLLSVLFSFSLSSFPSCALPAPLNVYPVKCVNLFNWGALFSISHSGHARPGATCG